MTRKVILSRGELHKIVWGEPLSVVARKYGMSEKDFRVLCIEMSIPMPRQNCWKKVRAGRVLQIAPLPVNYRGAASVTLSMAVLPSEDGDMSEDLELSDPLVVSARDSLLAKMKEKSGIVDGVVRREDGQLDIRVGPASIDRACRFMDLFIRALRQRSHGLMIRDKSTYVCVDGQELQIVCREKLTRVPASDPQPSYYSTEMRPTGVLALQLVSLFYGREWLDGTTIFLEDQIPSILDKMELLGREMNVADQERDARKTEREDVERQLRNWEQRREKELMDFKGLLRDAGRWRQAVLLREYIAEVEKGGSSVEGLAPVGCGDAGLASWLVWARGKADWYDPMVEAADEWLVDVDRGTLTVKAKW